MPRRVRTLKSKRNKPMAKKATIKKPLAKTKPVAKAIKAKR
jgi:hypothetical protein